jgi:Alpha-kinase family
MPFTHLYWVYSPPASTPAALVWTTTSFHLDASKRTRRKARNDPQVLVVVPLSLPALPFALRSIYATVHTALRPDAGLSWLAMSLVAASQIATSSIKVVETEHGRLRRQQRGIDKRDLQAALKYGERQDTFARRNGDQTAIYTYKDIVYVVNEASNKEVTVFAKPFDLDAVKITQEMQSEHDDAVQRLKRDPDCCKSHTVIVVDASGSMRKADVWGARNRLKGVLVCIALDFVAHRIEACEACPLDLVSIVTLAQKPQIIVQAQPCDYVLYNKIVDLYNNDVIIPTGHGPFMPALNLATQLLIDSDCHSSALTLCLFSDGRPSDHLNGKVRIEEYDEVILERIARLTEQFGARLTVTVIPIGKDQDFGFLKKVITQAEEYGTKAYMMTPSMSLTSIGNAMTSVATSVTESQIELIDYATRRQRKIRAVLREAKSQAAQEIVTVNPTDFEIIPASKVQRTVYREWLAERRRYSEFELMPLQNKDAAYVAVCKKPFGEGGERFAYRFFEVGADGETIVGKPLVAKESKFVLEYEDRNDRSTARSRFVKEFCKGQQLALRLSEEFNQLLDELPRVDGKTPRVTFLNCSVYDIENVDGKMDCVLVEERLDESKWHKWNSNNGYVDGMSNKPTFTSEQLNEAMSNQRHLDLITEEEEEEEDEEDEENEGEGGEHEENESKVTASQSVSKSGGKDVCGECKEYTPGKGRRRHRHRRPIVFTPSEVAQAFSHFTYWASGRKRLICDLQGVYDEKDKKLILSDPVIHYYNDFNNSSPSHRRYGDGNRERRGMAEFFATHECGYLCKLTTRGLKTHRSGRESYSPFQSPIHVQSNSAVTAAASPYGSVSRYNREYN